MGCVELKPTVFVNLSLQARTQVTAPIQHFYPGVAQSSNLSLIMMDVLL